MSYSELLSEYIKRSELSLGEIARRVNDKGVKIDKSYISKIKNGDANPPSDEITFALAEVTGGDPERLIWAGLIDKSHPAVKRSLMMVDKFIMRKAIELEKYFPIPNEIPEEDVDDYLEANPEYKRSYDEFYRLLGEELERVEKRNPQEDPSNIVVKESNSMVYSVTPQMSRIPVLGSIAAGQPIDRIEYVEGYELVEDNLLRGRGAFALRVKGDSMIGDRIQDGDIVIVVSQEEVSPTDIAVVAVSGESATLKRVKCQNNMCMLVPSNPAMEPLLIPAGDVHILGKVVQVRMNLN